MVTKTRAERLRSAIILFRFETDLIFGKMVAAWRFAKGNHHSRPRRDKLIRGAKGNKVKNQLKAKKSPSHGSIIDIDQQEVPIVARAPHEEGQDWEAMSVDDLWRLHESIVKVIAKKIRAETQRLENRLRLLGPTETSRERFHEKSPSARKSRKPNRRPYPQVKPKYRDHTNPSVTWSGRGKLPRWIRAQISLGRQLEDFKIG
jgi:DNA-binding protein H-NS